MKAHGVAANYQPVDELHLWYLAQPSRPLLIGEINLVRSTHGASLRYAEDWLQSGFPLSEDLPLIGQEFLPTDRGTAAGAVDDARPDRWGERVIRFIDKPKRGVIEGDLYVAHMRELFRRMVFNILIDNTDDHEKNHALLVTDAQQYELSPAYDVLPSGQALGFQQMRVGEQQADANLVNALSMSRMFALTRTQAVDEVRAVTAVVDGWQAHFAQCGVTAGDIDLYARHIDRPFLKEQRAEFRR
jgi:hypothetical protein